MQVVFYVTTLPIIDCFFISKSPDCLFLSVLVNSVQEQKHESSEHFTVLVQFVHKGWFIFSCVVRLSCDSNLCDTGNMEYE